MCAVGAGLYIVVVKGEFLRKRQRQQKRVLCHCGCTVVDNIGDFDAAALAVGQIYIVEACGEQTDQFYIGSVLQGSFVEGRFISHDDICVSYTLCRVFRHRIRIIFHFSEFLKAGYVNIRSRAVTF